MLRLIATAAGAAVGLLLLCGFGASPATSAIGDARHGQALIGPLGCGACHMIPHVSNATSLAGPPLNAMGRRTWIAGLLPNTPVNMIRWLRNPQAVVPGNAMPNVNLDERDARDIAAYLESLK